MALRHHYSVTVTAAEPEDLRFHLFAEADERFAAICAASESAGRRLVSESYWRRHYASEEGPEQRVALDDRGLGHCDDQCGGA